MMVDNCLLPAAYLQYGTDSSAAAMGYSSAPHHSGTYIGKACAAFWQVYLCRLCSSGCTAATTAVHIIHRSSITDTGDIPAANQCSIDRVDGDPGTADPAHATGRNGDMKLGVYTAAIAVLVAIVASSGATRGTSAFTGLAAAAGAVCVTGTARACAGSGSGRARAAAGSGAATGRTSIASAPGTGAGII